MTENAELFFQRLKTDLELQKKLNDAVMEYPGSLEIRESVCTGTLLPIADEAGLPFTIDELRKYETRVKMRSSRDEEINPDEPYEEITYWLLDSGWEDDISKFKK